MKKRDIADILTEKLELPRSKANRAVNLVFDSIGEQLRRGRQVSISGFGVFERERKVYLQSQGAGQAVKGKAIFKASRSLEGMEGPTR